MLWLDEKYINRVSPSLRMFRKVKQNQYVFRCPICGDSKQNEWKTRGGFYVPSSSQDYMMGCFNCGASQRFSTFLKLHDPVAYNEYCLEKFQDSKPDYVAPVFTESSKKIQVSGLDRIYDLDADHPAVKYLDRRLIDSKHHKYLYYCASYKNYLSKLDGDNRTFKDDYPRLIIPFFDRRGNITRISARAFGNESPKYLYTKLSPDASRLYGIDRVKSSERVYILEGPLDSLFFDNALAVGSADYMIDELSFYPNRVYVPDNQPRNAEVVAKIKKIVDAGYKVCLWDDSEHLGKDINQMVMDGISMTEILKRIESSTESGIMAKLKFEKWKKCE
jgi:transcription elongation factor Elf1